MKKLNIVFVVSFVVSIFLSATAFGNSGDNPSDVVKEYLNCVISEDYESMVMFLKGSENFSDEQVKQIAKNLEKSIEAEKKSEAMKEFTIIEETINDAGDEATVKVNVVAEDGTEGEEEISLSKVNGKWKIAG